MTHHNLATRLGVAVTINRLQICASVNRSAARLFSDVRGLRSYEVELEIIGEAYANG